MKGQDGRYRALTERLTNAVLETPGVTPSDLRRAVAARAAVLGGGRPAAEGPSRAVPAPLANYVDKVALHAYRVTDADLSALERAGTSQDAVFELTLSAALGAALGRLERGLAALRGEEPN
jgi:hypothetical protein